MGTLPSGLRVGPVAWCGTLQCRQHVPHTTHTTHHCVVGVRCVLTSSSRPLLLPPPSLPHLFFLVLGQSVCGGGQGLLLLTCDLPGARLRAVRPLESGSSSASVGGYTLEPVEAGSASDLTVLVWGAAEAGAAGEGAPAPDPWALLTAGWPAISAAAAVACKEALRGVPLCKCGW